MPTDPALPRRAGEQTLPRPVPSPAVQTVPPKSPDASPERSDDSFGSLHQANVRQSLGAVGFVCRSVLACVLAVGLALGLAAALTVLLLP